MPPPEKDLHEWVVLVHGLARSGRSMNKMQDFLAGSGYRTLNLDYPSTRKDIAAISNDYLMRAVHHCEADAPRLIHFVSHSMGGIIIRYAFKNGCPQRMGRVVMLAPPNQGSEAADRLHNLWLYKWLNGPAGQQLLTSPDSLPNRLGAVSYPVGIITGNKPSFFDGWLAKKIPGENDGKVAVKRARLAGMTDFLVLPENHTLIMNSRKVQRQTRYFLENGSFMHKSMAR